MRKDKEIALNLRRSGKSLNDIQKYLGIPKSTLSGWFKNDPWSKQLTQKLSENAIKDSYLRMKKLNVARVNRLDGLYEKARNEAMKEFDNLKKDPLFIAGLMIYWGEGDKTSKYSTRVSNIDPKMLRIFVNFLISICLIENIKIRAWVLIYPDLDEAQCKQYWMENTGLSLENFTKSIRIKGKHTVKKLNYGVGYVGVSNRYLKEKMLIWLSLMPDHLIKEYKMRV